MSAFALPEVEHPGATAISTWIRANRSKLNAKGLDDSLRNVSLNSDMYQIPFELLQIPVNPSNASGLAQPVIADSTSLKSSTQYTCLTCRLVFPEHLQQQEHFKSEWHVYNIKRKMKGELPIPEEEFNIIQSSKSEKADDPESVIASVSDDDEGKCSSDSENDANASDNIHLIPEDVDKYVEDDEILRKTYSDEFGTVQKVFSHITGPQFIVSPNTIVPYHFSFSTAVLRNDSPLTQRDWSYLPNLWGHVLGSFEYIRSKPYMAVMVLRSGRFAGAIFNNHNVRNPLIVHKVIRRYTVRAKAGGGQSSHDNKHGKAKSMGAQLRRYGEQMLQEDIERLLTAWVDYLGLCGVILIAATKAMRSNLFDKEESTSSASASTSNSTSSTKRVQLLSKQDPRVVFVPFAVDKPTLETALLIRDRALAVTISNVAISPTTDTPTIAETIVAPTTASTDMRTDTEVKTVNEVDEAASILLSNPHAQRIIHACTNFTDDLAVSCLRDVALTLGIDILGTSKTFSEEDNSDDENDEEEQGKNDSEVKDMAGALREHVTISRQNSATSVEDVEDILRLPNNLEELSSALHISSERNLLRTVRLLLQLGANPEQLDARGRTAYFLAKTKDMREMFRRLRGILGESRWQWNKTGVPEAITEEKLAQQKQKEKEKKKRAQQRKKEQKLKEEQQVKDAEIARQLQQQLQQQERVEREAQQRKAAGQCAICKVSLYGQDFYDVLEQRCCSTNCVQQLRRKLAADAALARFGKK